MLTEGQEREILQKAYVPEQIVGLMTALSGGEPYLLDDFLCLAKDDWVIVIGYPLGGGSQPPALENVLTEAKKRFRPVYLWFAAPEIPRSFSRECTERESDFYYVLNLRDLPADRTLMGRVRKASKGLRVERSMRMSQEHERLVQEFLARGVPSPRVRQLFLSMPRYAEGSSSCTVLSARDRDGRLAAMYVVELAAAKFAAYLVGCHSKENYVPYASDLLFYEMTQLAREQGKECVNLGLGVNQGIRRFKEKWGGVPWLRYEFCGCTGAKGGALQMFRWFGMVR